LAVRVQMDLGTRVVEFSLPAETDILRMSGWGPPLEDPAAAISRALSYPVAAPPLAELARSRVSANPAATACVVISDNTRPVPYKGEPGILWPVLEVLLGQGFAADRITVLIATGTHRAVLPEELREMLDARVFSSGVRIVNHDCRDTGSLSYLGTTRLGSELYVNRLYLEADLKVLTGLVESHFMAGASGGRKAIVPGLVGERSTQVFHGPAMLASPGARDLQLEGNPCHEESLQGARMAGADFIVNVTLDGLFQLTGVYAGDLEKAHALAVEQVRERVAIPLQAPYDIVVIHAGRVGINHYQAAKAGVAGASAARRGGFLVIAGHHTDTDPVGSAPYRTVLHLLKIIGPERFDRLLASPDWTFVHDQWEPQMWSKVLARVPPGHLYYCATGLSRRDYDVIPGRDGNVFLPAGERYGNDPALIEGMVLGAVSEAWRRLRKDAAVSEGAVRDGAVRDGAVSRPRIAYLADGPYGVPVTRGGPL